MQFLDWDHTPMLLSDDGKAAWVVFNRGERWSKVDPIEAAYARNLWSEEVLRRHFFKLYGDLPPIPLEEPIALHSGGAFLSASE